MLPLDSSITFMTSNVTADQNPLDASIPHPLLLSDDQNGAIPLDDTSHYMAPTMGGFVLPNLSLLHSQLTMFHECVSTLLQQHATLVSALHATIEHLVY